MTALDNSFVVFSQMEHTFNKERFKRKWVQSTAESLSLGRTTRVIDNLVTTANKSKFIFFLICYNTKFSSTKFAEQRSQPDLVGELPLQSAVWWGTVRSAIQTPNIERPGVRLGRQIPDPGRNLQQPCLSQKGIHCNSYAKTHGQCLLRRQVSLHNQCYTMSPFLKESQSHEEDGILPFFQVPDQ